MKTKIPNLLTLWLVSLLLPLGFAFTQVKPRVISLHVTHNGKAIRPPQKITFLFKRVSVTLPVKGGRFEVPPAARQSKAVRLSARIGDERLSIPGIDGEKFRQENWTIILADNNYGSDDQWVVPKGASVRLSCILMFDSRSSEATALFAPHCRFPSSGSEGAHSPGPNR